LHTADFTISFIGPLGVGKTSYFKKISNTYKNDWFFAKDLRKIYKSLQLKDNFFKLADQDHHEHYELLLNKKYKNIIRKNFSFPLKVSLYDFFKRELEKDIFLRNHSFPKGLFTDDGVIHNFTSEIVEIYKERDKYKGSDSFFKDFFRNRAFIHLTSSNENIVQNLKKRSIKTPYAGNDVYSVYGNENIFDYVDQSKEEISKLLEIAKSFDAKVITLDNEENFSENNLKIKKFVSDCCASRILEQQD
jgi:hypothetical protein